MAVDNEHSSHTDHNPYDQPPVISIRLLTHQAGDKTPMKIAITAETDAGLESPVAQHFGHAPYFVLADIADGAVSATQVITNPFAESHEPGQIPAFIHEQGAEVMISGGMGGRAIAFFEQAGIKTATGATGSVHQALQAYLNEGLQGAAPCAESVAHGHG